jgi:hypothetical protein
MMSFLNNINLLFMFLQQYDLLVCYHENIPRQEACLNSENLCATICLLPVLHSQAGLHAETSKAEGTPRKLATATQPPFPRTVISLS